MRRLKHKPTKDQHGNVLRRSDRVRSLMNGHTLWIQDLRPDNQIATLDWDANGAPVLIYAEYTEWMDSP